MVAEVAQVAGVAEVAQVARVALCYPYHVHYATIHNDYDVLVSTGYMEKEPVRGWEATRLSKICTITVANIAKGTVKLTTQYIDRGW